MEINIRTLLYIFKFYARNNQPVARMKWGLFSLIKIKIQIADRKKCGNNFSS